MRSIMAKRKRKKGNPILNSILTWSTTKYGIVTIIFAVWMGFFDQHNLWTKRKLSRTIEQLEGQVAANQSKLEAAKLEKIEIEQNIEKYAREKYYMHRPDEDVLIIDTKTETVTQ